MLAQNFQTPADLDIPDIHYEALVKVLGMLERGELRHVVDPSLKTIRGLGPWRPIHGPGLFNMNWWRTEFGCGTVCCIGGTAELVGKFSFREDIGNLPRGLNHLLFPGPGGDSITTEQAAFALRSYLSTGEPHWELALPHRRDSIG